MIATICPAGAGDRLSHGVRPPRRPRRGADPGEALAYLPRGRAPGGRRSRRRRRTPRGARSSADGRLLVGPDNGLLSLAAAGAGGVVEAVDIARSQFRLEPVSATFHGRDIFAPVAAQLAAGAPLWPRPGEPLDPDGSSRSSSPAAEADDGALVAHAVYVDRFGNVQLDAGHEELTTRA